MNKKKLVIACTVACGVIACLIAYLLLYLPIKNRVLFRKLYESSNTIAEDPFTKEIKNAPVGKTPTEAFELFFSNGIPYEQIEYDHKICVIGNTEVGVMIAEIAQDGQNAFRVKKVFDRKTDLNTGDSLYTGNSKMNCIRVGFSFSLPGSANSDEIIYVEQFGSGEKPSDTNHAVFYEIKSSSFGNALSNDQYNHWYALSDIDQNNYTVFWS